MTREDALAHRGARVLQRREQGRSSIPRRRDRHGRAPVRGVVEACCYWQIIILNCWETLGWSFVGAREAAHWVCAPHGRRRESRTALSSIGSCDVPNVCAQAAVESPLALIVRRARGLPVDRGRPLHISGGGRGRRPESIDLPVTARQSRPDVTSRPLQGATYGALTIRLGAFHQVPLGVGPSREGQLAGTAQFWTWIAAPTEHCHCVTEIP